MFKVIRPFYCLLSMSAFIIILGGSVTFANQDKPNGLPKGFTKIDVKVENGKDPEKANEMNQNWEGASLNITIEKEVRMGFTWTAGFRISDDKIAIVIRGVGYATNTPPQVQAFKLVLPNLKKRSYKIVPNITEKFLNN